MTTQRNHIDLITLLAVVALMVLSLGVVYSASSTFEVVHGRSSDAKLANHALKVLVSLAALFVTMQIDYRHYRRFTKPALLASVGLLCVTLVAGRVAKGAMRWITLGPLNFQPSEFAKFALIFHLCVLLATRKDKLSDFRSGYLPMLIWVGVVTGLVLMQPNFSTGAMIFVISIILLYAGGVRMSHIGLTLTPAVPALLAVMVLAPYRMQRITTFLSGWGSLENMNHQAKNSIIGFGSGGIFGLGPGHSRQRDLFLPESYGDFVFSIVGEEYGLIGSLCIMAVFLMVMLRGLRIARHAPDDFGKLLATGITVSIALYAMVHAGVTLSLLPTTGLPMPFISYGGTSMFFSACAIGVLLNISSQTDLHPRLLPFGRGAKAPQSPQPAVGKVY